MRGNSPDVVIVGGGVVGLACALRLQLAGVQTLVVDAAPASPPASWGNAGHVAIEQVQPLASPAALRSAPGRLFGLGGALDFRLSDLGAWGGWACRYFAACRAERAAAGAKALGKLLAHALPAWRRLADDLSAADLLVEGGHLIAWETPRSARVGRAAWAAADTGAARLRELADAERAALDSRLARPVVDAVGFAGTGQIRDLYRLRDALHLALERAGAVRRTALVASLPCASGRVGVRLEDGESLTPGRVVVAGGVGSGRLMRGLGYAAPVIAERGYHVEGPVGDWGGLPPVVFEDRAMIVTRFGDRLRAASFVEFGRPDAPPDARKWARLERHIEALGLPMGGARTRWHGARPTLPDYLPALGESARAANLIYAFGHQHLGLTLAPLTGELIGDLVLGRPPTIDLSPFDLSRFEARRP